MDQTVTSIERSLGVGRDFDVRPDGSWVGVFDRGGALHVEDSTGASFRLQVPVPFPIVRAVANDRVLVVDARPAPNTGGGFLLTMGGELLATLSIGDGVEDVVVLDDLIAITYFDEGVFSGVSPSEQGIAFFQFDGELIGGYQDMFGADAVDIADCYAACRVDEHTLAFTAYTGFQLVRVDPRLRRQDVLEVPKELHGASAVSVRGQNACFYGPYAQKSKLLRWVHGEHPEEIGRHTGPLRGLEGRGFLSHGEHGFTVVSWAG